MAKANEIRELDCDADVASGARLVLGARLAEMCALGEGAKNFSNIEGVHDMRVASRRLRSAMKDFALVVRRQGAFRRLGAEVKIVADALGVVRDQDVAMLALDDLSKKAPEFAREGIARIVGDRSRRREVGREALRGLITESNLAEMQLRWNAALENSSPASGGKGRGKPTAKFAAGLSFGDAGRIIIRRRWREFDELSPSLFRPFKVDPLHDLRIAAKRLRYAIELFSQCLGDELASSVKESAKEVAGMQAALGELHDCDVWIEWLGKRLRADAANDGGAKDRAPVAAREENCRAEVWLMRHFADVRTKHYRAALARWEKWQLNDFGKNLSARLATAASSESESESGGHKNDAAKAHVAKVVG